MKAMLAASFGMGAVCTLLGSPAYAQYESFRPPLGYYLNYACTSSEGRGEDIEVMLKSDQGGLALNAGPGIRSSRDSLVGRSQMLDVPALYDEDQQNLVAWEYEFMVNNVEDETQPTYRLVLVDQWDSDDAESLTVFEYLPTPNGRPRAPSVANYTCQVVGGGVNPFL